MTRDELAIVKEALYDIKAFSSVPLSWVKRNQQALKIVTLEQVKLHNGKLKNDKKANRSA